MLTSGDELSGGSAAEERGTLAGPVAQASGEVPAPWQLELGQAIRDVDELWRALDLPLDRREAARRGAGLFRLMVPRSFVARMRRGDPDDPLLRQVLPVAEENQEVPGFTADPLAETGSAPVPGLLHKYEGRALMVVTGACAVHCRYCFRRHFPYGELPRGRSWWSAAVAYLREAPSIVEVLLSGGDPLTLPDHVLAAIAEDLASVPHIRRLRIHTRLPVVLPSRVDGRLLSWFAGGRLSPVMVIHVNHPAEVSADVVAACRRLRDAGVLLLSQAVLLRGVNDDVGIQVRLSESLFEAGVVPYYLHALDAVAGAAHFAVDDAAALVLHAAMASRLPGYLVPRLVRELPGRPGKTPLHEVQPSE